MSLVVRQCPFCKEKVYSDLAFVYHIQDEHNADREWLRYNLQVWSPYDSQTKPSLTVKLIRLQCDEIVEHIEGGHDVERVVNELCDIASLASRQIEMLGFDFADAMIKRIRTRYDGKVEEIIAKYQPKIQD